jgi:hypothetical protein
MSRGLKVRHNLDWTFEDPVVGSLEVEKQNNN